MTGTMVMVAGVPLPLTGLLIALGSFVAAFAFMAFCLWSVTLLERVTAYGTDPKTAAWKKLVILIPWILLTLWYIVLCLITLGMVIHVANGIRDWWHGGK